MTRKKTGSSKLVKKLAEALAKPRVVDVEMTEAFKKLKKDIAEDPLKSLCERYGDNVGDFSTEGKCVVCGGEIVERRTREFDPMSGPLIFGPGSRRQFKVVNKGLHCSKCGLKYEFLPPADLKK